MLDGVRPLDLLIAGKTITAVYAEFSQRDATSSAVFQLRDGMTMKLIPVILPTSKGIKVDVFLPKDRTLSVARRFPLGDGAVYDRDLAAYFIGQEFERIEDGAQTDDGVDVIRLTLRSGNVSLAFPQTAPHELRSVLGLESVMRFVFLPSVAQLVYTPGMER